MSPRSSKKKSKKTKSKKSSGKGGPAAPADVYVSLLIISVAAILIGISFLALELGKYGWATAS